MISLLRITMVLALIPTVALSATEVNLNAMPGVKLLERADWEPHQTQGMLALQADIRPQGWPLAIAVNAVGSSDYDRRTVQGVGTVESYASVTEIQVGMAGLLALPGSTTLYLGGGGSFTSALYATWTSSDERTDWGYGVGTWAHAGAFWTIGRFNLGAGAGWSWVPLELDDHRVDAGGWRFGLLLGFNLK